MPKRFRNIWCVFLWHRKHGVSVLSTGLTEEEARAEVQRQVQQGERDVQRLRHGEYADLFGKYPKVSP